MNDPLNRSSRAIALSAALFGALFAFAFSGALLGCAHPAPVDGAYDVTNAADVLPDIALIDQYGHQFSLASLKGKPVLVDFIYTSCAGPCRMLTSKMEGVARHLSPQERAQAVFLSLTVDPEHDRPAQLLAYATNQGVERQGWIFATGTARNIERAMAAFKLVREKEPDGSIAHVEAVFLVGRDGHEMREYNSELLQSAAVARDVLKAVAKG